MPLLNESWMQYLLRDPSFLTLAIGAGVFLLTFAIIRSTTWGQDNPVSKCVVLSVLAHLVLLAYAYSLNLVTHVPVAIEPLVVPIQVADAGTDSQPEESDPESPDTDDAAAETPFWNDFAASEVDLTPSTLPATKVDTLPDVERIEPVDVPRDDPLAFPDRQLVADPNSNHGDAALRDFLDVPQNNSSWLDPLLQPTPPVSAPMVSGNVPPKATPTEELPEATDEIDRSQMAGTNESNGDRDSGQLLEDALSEMGPERMRTDQETLPDRWGESLADHQRLGHEQETGESELEQQRLVQQQRAAAEALTSIENPLNDRPLPPADGDPRRPAVDWAPPPRVPAGAAQPQPWRAAIRRIADGQALPAVYQQRFQRTLEDVQQMGGSSDTEQAVANGLAFLAAIQKPDGSWNPRETGGGREQQILGHNRQGAGAQADTGITGLALLAFLADGSTHLQGPYQETVRRGLEYLMQRQQRGGSLAGGAQYYAQMYCHSMALLALSEAYALTGDARLQSVVELGGRYSLDTQNRAGGGWRYQPQEAGDMSQFGWQVLALRSAAHNGLNPDAGSQQLMNRFLNRHSRGTHGGLAIYRLGEAVSPAMTAEALVCRYLLEQRPDQWLVEEACREIIGLAGSAPGPDADRRLVIQDCRHLPGRREDNLYFWYYACLALRQAASDPALADSALVQQSWELWNRQLTNRLLNLQQSSGPLQGSWDPEACLWGGYGGRVYTTSLAVLCLQVYYRYDFEAAAGQRTALVPWSPDSSGPAPPPATFGPVGGRIGDR